MFAKICVKLSVKLKPHFLLTYMKTTLLLLQNTTSNKVGLLMFHQILNLGDGYWQVYVVSLVIYLRSIVQVQLTWVRCWLTNMLFKKKKKKNPSQIIISEKMGKGRHNDKADNVSDSFDVQNSSHDRHDSNLYCAGIDFNQRLREQASKVSEYYKEKVNRLDLRNVDFECLLRFIDPWVWNMFTIMSMNFEEKKMLSKNPLSWDERIR